MTGRSLTGNLPANAPIAHAVLRIVLPYAFVSGLWILLSDRALEALVDDPSTFAQISIYKGWGFVAVTALLLIALLRGELRKRQRAYDQLEIRVSERTAELAIAKEAAESADRLKSAFLATMSHELRTPLNSIIGFTGIVTQELAGPLNEEQKKQLGMVQNSARRLLALINDVLDLSRIEVGEFDVAHEPYDPRACVDKVVGMLRPAAEKKQLALTAHIDGDIGVSIGDAHRIEQILFNLLSNAIKFTDSGGISLSADRTGGANGASDEIRIRVADTGPGIDAHDLEELFRPFHQLDSTLARKHDGTGLGLALSRRLAALMGGCIEVESRVGRGSVFTLAVPAHPNANVEKEAA